VGDGDGDEAGGRRKGRVRVARAMATVMRVAGGKEAMMTAADGDNGGGRAMVMAMKRVMVMVMATRVGEGGRRQNGHWRRRQERW
jgi:hypothetical protein